VLCLDEFGPLEIRPQLGENWVIKPDLVPATYTREKGIRHLIAFLDLGSDKLYGHIKKRKRWMELLHVLKYMRTLYKGKLYVILDNFSPHIKEEVTSWCEKNDIELVFLPTNASWLNRIECHFTALRKFVLAQYGVEFPERISEKTRKY
jgi:hypothetical protein